MNTRRGCCEDYNRQTEDVIDENAKSLEEKRNGPLCPAELLCWLLSFPIFFACVLGGMQAACMEVLPTTFGTGINSQTARCFLVKTDALILYMDQACRVSEVQEFFMAVFTNYMHWGGHFSFLWTVAPYSEELFYYLLQNEVLLWQGIRACTKRHYSSLCFFRKIKKSIQYHCTYNWQNTIAQAGV